MADIKMKEMINRIKEMEECFDTLLRQFNDPNADIYRELLHRLIEYYEGGLWRADFEADENGLLPQKLKRGVLSEDGVYNLLTDIFNSNGQNPARNQ